MNTSPHAWLWQEIARRFGEAACAELRADFLQEMRAYNRRVKKSKLTPDAPRQAAGRKAQ